RRKFFGTSAARVGEADLERVPQGSLGCGHGCGGVLRDRLGQGLGFRPEVVWWVDDLADHPELERPRRRDALVATDHGHAHHRLERNLADDPDGHERDEMTERYGRV